MEKHARGGLELFFFRIFQLSLSEEFGREALLPPHGGREGGARAVATATPPDVAGRRRQGAPAAGRKCDGGGVMADYEAVQRGPLRLKGSGGALGAGKR